MSKTGLRKSGRFVIFWPPFWSFWTEKSPIGIYRKTGPTKSTVLGPGPPPGNFNKIYRKSGFFWIFGPSIEPEKASVKSASTPYPPWKVNFIDILLIRDPIYDRGSTKHVWDVFSVLCSSHLSKTRMSFADICLLLLLLVFLVFLTFLVVFLICVVPLCMITTRNLRPPDKSPSNKGLRAKSKDAPIWIS
jgi:hypothetical protein